MRAIGVDEHVWRHTRRGDKYVTVIIDLTPIREGTGPARLLDMVEGCCKQVFKTWLVERPQAWRDDVQRAPIGTHGSSSDFATPASSGSRLPDDFISPSGPSFRWSSEPTGAPLGAPTRPELVGGSITWQRG